MDEHAVLDIPAAAFADLEEHFEERTDEGWSYRHLPDYRGDLERGTVLIGDTAVRGFPKVPRTLVLETGIPRHFDGEVAVEEKLDGYNVRAARIDGEVLGFTRSGIICPFTTARVRSLLDLDPFFDDYPDLMVCGELYGPENPYTAHDYPDVDSIAFRAFDLRDRETGTPLPVEERRERCGAYDIPQVPLHGVYGVDEAVEAVPGIIHELEAEGREGVVMKDGGRQLKYTTSAANQGDLEYAFSLPFDYGQDFMFRRLIREAFQAVERGEGGEAMDSRAHDIGESILHPMVDAIREVEAGGAVGERHTVRGAPDTIADLLAHLRDLGLRIDVESDECEEEERVVTFTKRTQSTNDSIKHYLEGGIVRE